MHQRLDYTPPTTDDLQRLKDSLGYTGAQMADLAGVSGSNQWRKYTGGAEPRQVNMHMMFFIAARLTLPEAQFGEVLAKMAEMGALVGMMEV